MIGFYTLFKKEILRFWKVGFQNAGRADDHRAVFLSTDFFCTPWANQEALPDVAYNAFLIPGLAMMSMTQNAFANSQTFTLFAPMNTKANSITKNLFHPAIPLTCIYLASSA